MRWLGHVGTERHNRELFGADGAQFESRIDGECWLFAADTSVRGRGRGLLRDYRLLGGHRTFFEPGCEILVARSAGDIVDLLRTVDAKLAREMGDAMRRRALLEHTYSLRALQVREILRQSTGEVLAWRGRELQQPA